ncbi:hypothetical protein YK48G_04480 [Lentilactobacillus fungorum]|uniref:DUF4352 domain-containing protein n=1 Tax=Lentilactobacillus fungorum TaxID=2201250 RepID=A0ABQ3VVV4_9LACO|nr:DUF4352 domain-containing protein [Lentilactobacillus fungorum]GHP13023.1 hypothetical protein YK48G_04480 [Lentilactobacillus fungorum]
MDNQKKQPKPWYKVWWFWILVIIIVLVLGGMMNDSSSSSSSSDRKPKAHKVSPFKRTYKVGQVVNYKGYKFKVNRVKYFSGNSMDTPKSGNQYVICNVTIKNDSHEKQDYNEMDFQLSANGNTTDFGEILTSGNYENNTLDSGSLDKGATVSGNLIGQAKKDAKLKLEYQPSFLDDKTINVNLN